MSYRGRNKPENSLDSLAIVSFLISDCERQDGNTIGNDRRKGTHFEELPIRLGGNEENHDKCYAA
jgi:hypothetical protein